MEGAMFDDLTEVYEAMIDWPKRLAHETPFYRRWFDRAGAARVLDAACGTGRHAAMFHQWGLEVEAADLSPGMIAQARAAFGEPAGLRWVVRGYDAPVESGPFDAVVCVGNSLALAPDAAAAARAVVQMVAALRPGGVLLVQSLNLWRLPEGPCLWQKCKRVELSLGDVLILKGVHRCGGVGYVDLALASAVEGGLRHSESVPFLGLEADELDRLARAAGAAEVHCFGNYREQPYDRASSVDLIVVARKSVTQGKGRDGRIPPRSP